MVGKSSSRSFFRNGLSIIRMGLVALALAAVVPLNAAAETSKIDETKQAVQDATSESMEAAGSFFQRVNESGVQNWTRDEIVAWLIMALLVGSAAGMFYSKKTNGLGKLIHFMFGLVGALAGCTLVRAGPINHGWGGTMISYEALVYSFGVALLLIVGDRILSSQKKKKKKS